MSKKRIHILRETVIALVLSLVLVSSLSIKTVNAQAGQVTLKPTDDTYVDSSNPNSNYGGQDNLEISNWGFLSNTYESIVWLKFGLSAVPDGAVVDTATLQLYTSLVGETFNVHAYSCSDNSWMELTLTYSNMPSHNTTSMDSVLVTTRAHGRYQWYNWSVVDAVRNALNGNPKSVTIVMQEPVLHSSVHYVWFESKESPVYFTDYSPRLTIHWNSFVPEFPTFLVLLFFMIATLIAVIVYRKKHAKISNTPHKSIAKRYPRRTSLTLFFPNLFCSRFFHENSTRYACVDIANDHEPECNVKTSSQ